MCAATVPSHVSPDRVFDFDIRGDAKVSSNVHDDYATLHEKAPEVFYTPRNGGHWMITSHDIIGQVVRDPEHFSANEQQIPRIENPPTFIPLSLDPPHNVPYRQALMPHFSPKAVKAMEEKVRYWAAKLIDDVVEKGECDFVYDIASVFPVSIFMEFMGMPMDRLREFRALSDAFFSTNEQEKIHELSVQIIGVMMEIMAEKKANPADDLMSHLLEVKIEGGRKLRDDEIQNMCFLLFLGGMDTVANVTAFTYRHLAQDTDLQKRLAENPDDIQYFVDEGLRLFGVINTPRIVAKDCEKFGVTFKKGDMVLNILPVSGRDPKKMDNPNTFDIDRQKREYLTFSTGPHLCIGHFLARTELRILTEEWVKRIPSFRLKPSVEHDYRLGLALALVNLPVEW